MNSPSFRINAYVLAADPAWIEASVRSYYDLVQTLVVSYDERHRSWTGTPIAVDECLARLRKIDCAGKMRFCPGRYSRPEHSPMHNDTFQRQCAHREAGVGADWVLQLDTDELLPSAEALVRMLRLAEVNGLEAVEWPMRVLYRQLADGRYLEVCGADRRDHFEYPGPVAVRQSAKLVHARRTDGPFLRPVVMGDDRSLQVRHAPRAGEHRENLLQSSEAILHNSWARSSASIRSKIGSWSHNEGWKSWAYYYCRWLPARFAWELLRDFHPFERGLWPALKVSTSVPRSLLNNAIAPSAADEIRSIPRIQEKLR
jgi:hypothetical protein